MSLFGALNIGVTAMTTSQAALQVTGNNIANASNPDYAREVALTQSLPNQQLQPGMYIGTGVDLSSIQREVDNALNGRVLSANSDSNGASVSQQWTSQLEGAFNALGSNSLDTQLTSFLSSWSSLANSPTDSGARQAVIQSGQQLANEFNSLSTQLTQLQGQSAAQLTSLTSSANGLAQQIANLNAQIANGGGSSNNGLQDQMSGALTSLSQLTNIQSVNQPNGTVNVYIGSQPLVMGAQNRGLKVQASAVNGQASYLMQFASDSTTAPITTGQIGGIVGIQSQLATSVTQLNQQAGALIFGLNSIHASGQGTEGFTSVTSTNQVLDPTAALNSPNTGLKFQPTNGSFVITVTNTTTGLKNSTLIPVNLTGAPGDTTLNSLAASLNAVSGVQASIQGGSLTIKSTSSGQQISFSQDTSNVLPALGINTFFTGSDATSIGVNSTVTGNPSLLAASQNGDPGDASNALAISNLGTQSLSLLNGQTWQSGYNNMIGAVTSASSQAQSNATATGDILTTLQSQQQATSGVNIDEETVNMLQQQRTYQGAAVMITTINQMMTSLLAITSVAA